MSKPQHPTPKEFFIQKVTEQLGEEPTPQHKISIAIASLMLDEYAQLFTKKTKPKKGKLTPEQEAELEIKMVLYNETFPKIKIPTSNLPARSTPRELRDGFKWFLTENPKYDWDTILKATSRYVREYESKNWEYMRTSKYFLRKQNTDKTWTSDLERYCMMIAEGSPEDNYEQRGPSVKVV